MRYKRSIRRLTGKDQLSGSTVSRRGSTRHGHNVENCSTRRIAPVSVWAPKARLFRLSWRRHIDWIAFGLVFLGFAMALPQWLEINIRFLSPSLIVGLLLSWFGWKSMPRSRILSAFRIWAIGFLIWAIFSGVKSMDFGSIYLTFTNGIWLLYIVPGLASLMRESRNRIAMVNGLVLGVAVYLFAVAVRVGLGKNVLDPYRHLGANLLGRNRNGVNAVVLLVFPFFLPWMKINFEYILRRIRVVLFVLAVFWFLNSGGRTGVLGALFVIIVYALTQGQFSRKLRSLLVLGLLVICITTILAETNLISPYGTDRLSKILTSSGSDESRRLLLKKAWYLALDNPVFGIGFGNFRGTYHPIIEEASTRLRWEVALNYEAHNTYAEIMADVGFPGLFLFLGMLGKVLTSCRGKMYILDIKIGLCVVSVVLFDIFFHTAFSTLIFYPIAFLLGALLELDNSSNPNKKIISPRYARLP